MTPTSQPLDRKLFAGARLKRVRLGLGLTQTSMAEALEVSVSYLNLIERNQRPMSAQFLLKLAQTFEVDLRVLTTDHTDGLENQLKEILRDPLFRGLDFTPEDSVEATRTTPNIVEAMTRLYAAYQAQTRSDWSSSAPDAHQRASAPTLSPLSLVRDYIQAHLPSGARLVRCLTNRCVSAPGRRHKAAS
jgi:XRE family transcriptional regulator, fatty acid utilization regulator